MPRYAFASLACGLAFGLLDGLINGNPLARKLLSFYGGLARARVNVAAGLLIDLAYGFLLCAVFLMLRGSLPGSGGAAKGLALGLLVWVLRALMGTLSQWMILDMPPAALAYLLISGLVELLLLGAGIGLLLGA